MLLLQLPVLYYISLFPGKPIDRSHGLIQKLGLEALINAGNWKSVEKKVLELPADDLTRVIDGICNQENLIPKIEEYLETESSEFQDVLAGAFYIIKGWKIRSGAWAKDVGDDQWEGFSEHLNLAAERLNKSFDSPKLALEGMGRMIQAFQGFGEKEEAIKVFNYSKELTSSHYLSHTAMHRILTPRWHGSNEEMIDFGNSIEDDHLRGLIQLSTLVEIYSDMNNKDEDEDEKQSRRRFNLQHKDLIKEVLSNLKVPTGDSMLTINFKNHLACLYSIIGMKKERDKHLNELNGKISYRPWCYFGMHNARDVKLYKMVGMI